MSPITNAAPQEIPQTVDARGKSQPQPRSSPLPQDLDANTTIAQAKSVTAAPSCKMVPAQSTLDVLDPPSPRL